MARAIYIGGLNGGKRTAEGVASVLERYFEEVEPYTFSYAIQDRNRKEINMATEGATVFSHSAGIMAVHNSDSDSIHAFNGPLPMSRAKLLGKTVVKTARILNPRLSGADRHDVRQFSGSTTAELVYHPVRNLRPFVNGDISRWNTIYHLGEFQYYGVKTVARYSNKDTYFCPSNEDLSHAERMGVIIASDIEGEHDALPLAPDLVLPSHIEQYV